MKDKSSTTPKTKGAAFADAAPAHASGAQPDARGVRVAIVVSSYHRAVTEALHTGARQAFLQAGGAEGDVVSVPAPGAFELPVLTAALLRRPDIAAVVAIGCVVKGETRHDRYICAAVTEQLARLAVDAGKPVGYGLLTVDTMKQARARAGGRVGNKGEEAMHAALAALQALNGVGA